MSLTAAGAETDVHSSSTAIAQTARRSIQVCVGSFACLVESNSSSSHLQRLIFRLNPLRPARREERAFVVARVSPAIGVAQVPLILSDQGPMETRDHALGKITVYDIQPKAPRSPGHQR